MEELAKSDIFFVITAVAVVLLSVFAGVAFVYLIRILRTVRNITDRVDTESKLIASDISDFRTSVKAEGLAWTRMAGYLKRQIMRLVGGRKKRAEREKE